MNRIFFTGFRTSDSPHLVILAGGWQSAPVRFVQLDHFATGFLIPVAGHEDETERSIAIPVIHPVELPERIFQF
jgi:hypothetical protein